MSWSNKIVKFFGVVAVIAMLVTPAFAQSQRVSPSEGYAAQDINMEAPYEIGYSAGLDVVYGKVSSNHLTRAFLHEQTNNDGVLEVELFNYNGKRVVPIYSQGGFCWPQTVKKIGNKIWFSYTGGSNNGFYSVPWDETLASYPASTASLEVESDYNWEVDQDPYGRVFVCGATGMSGGHSIAYVDQDNANNLITVINIGGYSSGFAIDRDGNVWSGEYLLGFSPNMHIEPCRLGMWSKTKVDNAIESGEPLTWEDADVIIPLGSTDITGQTTNWGPNDVEADSEGNIYVSMNTYDEWSYTHEYGLIVKVSPDGSGGYTMTPLATTVQRTGTNQWDWARSLAYDGSADIDAGGYTDPTQDGPTANILFLDMDMGTFSNDVDQVVAITVDSDFDEDGVPDAVDNAPETSNPDQVDTDGDMYGNICDADFDNDGNVGMPDFIILKQSWLSSDPLTDMDSDGNVGMSDFTLFRGRWLESAPYY